jgi:hypothetical protein
VSPTQSSAAKSAAVALGATASAVPLGAADLVESAAKTFLGYWLGCITPKLTPTFF